MLPGTQPEALRFYYSSGLVYPIPLGAGDAGGRALPT